MCAGHGAVDYDTAKRRCDEYFQNTHRGEARGIGGIFFDYVDQDLERAFEFVQDAGQLSLVADPGARSSEKSARST